MAFVSTNDKKQASGPKEVASSPLSFFYRCKAQTNIPIALKLCSLVGVWPYNIQPVFCLIQIFGLYKYLFQKTKILTLGAKVQKKILQGHIVEQTLLHLLAFESFMGVAAWGRGTRPPTLKFWRGCPPEIAFFRGNFLNIPFFQIFQYFQYKDRDARRNPIKGVCGIDALESVPPPPSIQNFMATPL